MIIERVPGVFVIAKKIVAIIFSAALRRARWVIVK
jgi:hypothetical protein